MSVFLEEIPIRFIRKFGSAFDEFRALHSVNWSQFFGMRLDENCSSSFQ